MRNLKSGFPLGLLIVLNVAVLGVLGFYSTGGAAPQSGQPPFANSVEQRAEMVRELQEIKELLKEQNALLKAGASKTAHDKAAANLPIDKPVQR